SGSSWACPSCGHMPREEDGIPLFAPDLADAGAAGFADDVFAELADVEGRSFWFAARNRLVTWAMRRYFPAARSMLEVGCGTGFVSAGVQQANPLLRLVAGEISIAGLKRARARVGD